MEEMFLFSQSAIRIQGRGGKWNSSGSCLYLCLIEATVKVKAHVRGQGSPSISLRYHNNICHCRVSGFNGKSAVMVSPGLESKACQKDNALFSR